MNLLIRTTNINTFFLRIQLAQIENYTVETIRAYWQWSEWRYVKVYEATMVRRVTIRFNFGPVTERSLPDLEEV